MRIDKWDRRLHSLQLSDVLQPKENDPSKQHHLTQKLIHCSQKKLTFKKKFNETLWTKEELNEKTTKYNFGDPKKTGYKI